MQQEKLKKGKKIFREWKKVNHHKTWKKNDEEKEKKKKPLPFCFNNI